jgi:hypothetical protein
MYKNEAYCSYALAFVFSHTGVLSVLKATLIAPFLYTESALAKLSNSNTEIRSLEEYVAKYPSTITTLSRMYKKTLPITLNGLMLLGEMQKIRVNNGVVELIEAIPYEDDMGLYLQKAWKASPSIARILTAQEADLYVNLRIVP